MDRIDKEDTMDTLVSVVMGSRSDWQTMKYVSETLAGMSVSHEVHIVSARRTSNRLLKYAKSVEVNRVKVIIASASGAVYLPGILASKTHIPVIGVPINTKKSKAPNSSLSLMHMPIGLPVGTLAMGPAGAVNAALLATNILANDHDVIRKALVNYRAQQITPSPHMMNPSVAV